jgi:trk system potassium uptake protein TrkA
MPEGTRSEWRDATGTINLSEVHPAADWYGSPVLRIENVAPARVAFITRLGEGLIPDEHTVLQEGDLVHVIVEEGKLAAVEAALAKSPEES